MANRDFDKTYEDSEEEEEANLKPHIEHTQIFKVDLKDHFQTGRENFDKLNPHADNIEYALAYKSKMDEALNIRSFPCTLPEGSNFVST